MMITYDKACEIIHSAQKFGIVLGLERMEYILAKLDHPEKKIKTIHLAGTNGKGSTLTYIKSFLIEAGYQVGTFTSPQINRINDKIQVDGIDISNEDFAQLTEQLIPIIDELASSPLGSPTEFEIITAIAFQYFAERGKPDWVLLETGLGGRLDSTNVIQPILSIITNIGFDHMNILGNTVTDIAKEKAGIIKKGIPVISGCKQKEAVKVIKDKATQSLAPLFQLGEDFHCSHSRDTFSFTYGDIIYPNIKAGMLGLHQQENATLALMAVQLLVNCKEIEVNEEQVRVGLRNAKIANRIEVVQEKPTVIFDGGHNPEGIAALATTLSDTFPHKKITVIFCAMKDKDIPNMLHPLQDVAAKLILTTYSYERAMNPYEVEKSAHDLNCQVITDWKEAYYTALHTSSDDDVIVVTGSLYFLAHVRSNIS